MKKLVSILLTLLLCATCFAVAMVPASAGDGGKCGENVSWAMDNEGNVTITGTGPMTEYNQASDSPFYDKRYEVKTIVIEDGVTSVGQRSFVYCTNLEVVSIPHSVEYIGVQAFMNCDSLSYLSVGENCTAIRDYACRGCTSLRSVSLFGGTTISKYAFGGCSAIERVYFYGTDDEWANLDVDTGNTYFRNVNPTYEVMVTQIAGPGGYINDSGTQTIVRASSGRGELQMVWARPADGYRFVGWYKDGELYSTEAELTIFPTENMTLTAKFEKIEEESHCAWCGGHHDNAGLIEMLIGWFHGILALLLGARY